MKNLKKLLCCAAAVITTSAVAGEPEIQEVKYQKLILQNEFLTVELLPESMGPPMNWTKCTARQ